MYLRLETSDNFLQRINEALFNLFKVAPSIVFKNQVFYKIKHLDNKAIKVIAWIVEYYPETFIDISENMNIGGVDNGNGRFT